MTFRLFPVPHIHLVEGNQTAELMLNAVSYTMTVGLFGSFVWLAVVAWLDRSN